MTKSQNFWRQMSSTLWFLPSLLAAAGAALGLAMVAADYYIGTRLGYHPRFFDVQPSGARDMLAVVAGSMITVAGTVFSITIVALTLASTQFSPRILRNFMRDRGNQTVLGTFVGIFAYSIVVLRTVRDGGGAEADFVPSLSVALGVLFGLAGIGFLIYFIHHVGSNIQATTIIAQIAAETRREIERIYKFSYDPRQSDAAAIARLAARRWRKIPSRATGYIQNADTDALFELAKRLGGVVRIRRRVGEFTIEGLPLLEITVPDEAFEPGAELIDECNEAYSIGDFRTVEGDVAFGIRQIVDIALKALSPAVNDSTTGLSCIDYLTATLVALARRESFPPLHFCEGELRLVANPQRFEDYFDLAFNQIRQNASGNVAVILRLLNAMETLGKVNQSFANETERRERHELLETQARLLAGLAERTVGADADLATARKRYEHVKETFEGSR